MSPAEGYTSEDPFLMKSWELHSLAQLYKEIVPWRISDLNRAHRFLFGVHSDVPESFIRFGEDLVKRGLFRLPFDYTIMEFRTGEQDHPMLDRVVFLCEQIAIPEKPSDDGKYPPFLVTIYPLIRSKDGGWTSACDDKGEPQYLTIDTGRPSETPYKQFPFYRQAPWDKIGSAAQALCPAATVMMMSRSITVTKVEIPARLAAARKRSGKPALFGFHVVKVPTMRDRLGDDRGMLIRKSPMLHWRRGHYRTLAHEKIIPVAPCLVGVEERGIIAKVYDAKQAHL